MLKSKYFYINIKTNTKIMITKEDVRQRYRKEDKRIIEFLEFVIESMIDDIKNVPEYFYLTLDLLKDQLFLYYSAYDALKDDEKVTTKDYHGRIFKSPAVQVMTMAWSKIVSLCSQFALTPFSKKKLARLDHADDTNTQEVLDNLLNG